MARFLSCWTYRLHYPANRGVSEARRASSSQGVGRRHAPRYGLMLAPCAAACKPLTAPVHKPQRGTQDTPEPLTLCAPTTPPSVRRPRRQIAFGVLLFLVALNWAAIHFGLIRVSPNTIPWRTPHLDAKPGLFVHLQMQGLLHDQTSCRAALDHASELSYSPLADKADNTGCGFTDVVELKRIAGCVQRHARCDVLGGGGALLVAARFADHRRVRASHHDPQDRSGRQLRLPQCRPRRVRTAQRTRHGQCDRHRRLRDRRRAAHHRRGQLGQADAPRAASSMPRAIPPAACSARC